MKSFREGLVWLNILLFTSAVLHAAPQAHSRDRIPATSSAFDPWDWTTKSWTGDDRPYYRMRVAVDKALSQGQKPEVLMRTYKAAAQKSSNPQVKFRWAYATYRTAIKGSAYADRELLQAKRSLERVPFPRTYEYARLRFLLDARTWPSRQLKGVGERLVRRNPRDYEVKYYLVKILDPGSYPSETRKAIAYSQDLIRLNPKRLSGHTALGATYFKIWLRSKNRVDGNKAITAYRRFLQLAPTNHGFRSQAQSIIKLIQSRR